MYKITKYERVRIIGTRAHQISMGAPPNVEIGELTDSYEIAEKEYWEKKIPLLIVRKFPNGMIKELSLSEMDII